MTDKYTSLKLSKLLAENGFEGDNKLWWVSANGQKWQLIVAPISSQPEGNIPAYDILNDLCVRYAKKMFGESCLKQIQAILFFLEGTARNKKYVVRTIDKTFTDVEDYIWEHCLFNPKNKV